MLFSSMMFLWVFLPIVLVGNFALTAIPMREEATRVKLKNAFLLSSSIIFYAFGGVAYILLMFSVIVLNYCGGFLVIPGRHGEGTRKASLIFLVFLNFCILFFFKYFNMFGVLVENIMAVLAGGSFKAAWNNIVCLTGTGELNLLSIALPIGISFYIFQAVSYVVDVYRGRATLQQRFSDFALYVSFFPQLIAGPIVQYADVSEQIRGRNENITGFTTGIKRFCYGLGKKVIIANTMAEVADEIWKLDITKIGASIAWFGIIAYTLQIYFDFSGYSDMAIGLGHMFGFKFKENFNYPYTSCSVQEFWRRWHISLSSWFREYVYIPLGGSREGTFKTCRNLFIVFLLTGIWHGANLTFWVWGLMYAVLLIAERLFLGKFLEKHKGFGWFYTMFFVMIGWIYFRSDNLNQARLFISRLFMKGTGDYTVLSYLSMKTLVVLILAILFCGFFQRIFARLYKKISGVGIVCFADVILQILIFAYSVLLLISGTYNPFIYFQF